MTNVNIKTNNYIIKAIKKHSDLYDYSKVKYIDAKNKIEIICTKHGSFLIQAGNHLSGQGCPKCKGRKKTTDDFITQAKQIHGDKYDYLETVYQRCDRNVIIICPIPGHGHFTQQPSNHLNGKGCPECGHQLTASKKTKTQDVFISQATAKHNNKYDYTNINYINSSTKIPILCPDHGEFLQKPSHHLWGQGCPKCGMIAAIKKRFENKQIYN